MFRTILGYGLIAGLIVGIPLFCMGVFLDSGHVGGVEGMALGYTIMLIALTTVFVAIKRRRDGELGGVIRFWPAFGYGLAISSVAGILYVVSWEAAMLSWRMISPRPTPRRRSTLRALAARAPPRSHG